MKAVIQCLTYFKTDEGKEYASAYLVENRKQKDMNTNGSKPLKTSIPPQDYMQYMGIDFPCTCEFDQEMISGGGGKGSQILTNIKPIKS